MAYRRTQRVLDRRGVVAFSSISLASSFSCSQTESTPGQFIKRLIRSLKEYCIKNGIREFFVLAYEEDERAIEFYRATGGKSEKVVNFLYEAVGK